MGSVPVVGDQARLRFRISENGLKVTTVVLTDTK